MATTVEQLKFMFLGDSRPLERAANRAEDALEDVEDQAKKTGNEIDDSLNRGISNVNFRMLSESLTRFATTAASDLDKVTEGVDVLWEAFQDFDSADTDEIKQALADIGPTAIAGAESVAQLVATFGGLAVAKGALVAAVGAGAFFLGKELGEYAFGVEDASEQLEESARRIRQAQSERTAALMEETVELAKSGSMDAAREAYEQQEQAISGLESKLDSLKKRREEMAKSGIHFTTQEGAPTWIADWLNSFSANMEQNQDLIDATKDAIDEANEKRKETEAIIEQQQKKLDKSGQRRIEALEMELAKLEGRGDELERQRILQQGYSDEVEKSLLAAFDQVKAAEELNKQKEEAKKLAKEVAEAERQAARDLKRKQDEYDRETERMAKEAERDAEKAARNAVRMEEKRQDAMQDTRDELNKFNDDLLSIFTQQDAWDITAEGITMPLISEEEIAAQAQAAGQRAADEFQDELNQADQIQATGDAAAAAARAARAGGRPTAADFAVPAGIKATPTLKADEFVFDTSNLMPDFMKSMTTAVADNTSLDQKISDLHGEMITQGIQDLADDILGKGVVDATPPPTTMDAMEKDQSKIEDNTSKTAAKVNELVDLYKRQGLEPIKLVPTERI
jgi:hypothetical protein